jgi:hypothetical protein
MEDRGNYQLRISPQESVFCNFLRTVPNLHLSMYSAHWTRIILSSSVLPGQCQVSDLNRPRQILRLYSLNRQNKTSRTIAHEGHRRTYSDLAVVFRPLQSCRFDQRVWFNRHILPKPIHYLLFNAVLWDPSTVYEKQQQIMNREISGSHGGEYENGSILGFLRRVVW